MARALLILNSQENRQKAARWCIHGTPNSRVEFKGPKRTLPQNDKMWAALTDISTQATHHGLRLTPDDWKLLFLDALKREVRMVPNLDGNGFVSLGRSSSDLDKEEMSDLINIIHAWGAQNGVVFHDGEGVPA